MSRQPATGEFPRALGIAITVAIAAWAWPWVMGHMSFWIGFPLVIMVAVVGGQAAAWLSHQALNVAPTRRRRGTSRPRGAGKSQPAYGSLTLEQLQAMNPAEFERLAKKLFEREGYRDRRHRPGLGDLGVDIDLTAPNGERAVVQCKRYKADHPVEPREVYALVGSASHFQARQVFFVTSSRFTPAASRFAEANDVVLIDGPQFIQLLHGPRGALQELVRWQSSRLQLNGLR